MIAPAALRGIYLFYKAVKVSGGSTDSLAPAVAVDESGGQDQLLSALRTDRVPSTSDIIGSDAAMGLAVTVLTLGLGGQALFLPVIDAMRLKDVKLEKASISSPRGWDAKGYLFFERDEYTALEVTASPCDPDTSKCSPADHPSTPADHTAACAWK